MTKMRTIIAIVLLIIGCSMQNKQAIKLPSTIFSYDMRQPSCIYYDGKKIEFFLSKKTEKDQSICGWLNNKDLLFMIESSQDNFGNVFYDNLYLVDVNKTIVDTVYSADITKGEIISGAYITPNDSILLIHIHYAPIKKDAEGWFYSPLDILIMDLRSKDIIDRIKSFYSYNIHYRQSSSYIFSPDGERFVYSISDERNWYIDEREKYQLPNIKKNGIYIYNMVSKEHQNIIDGGVDPIWSPDGNTIAYSENKKVWFYDLKSKEKTLFYEAIDNHTVVKIIWTPDGKNIYVLTREKTKLNPRGILTHRLINIKDKSETINGELIKLGLSFYWK